MSLQLMKERMKISGISPRDEMIRDGQNLLKEELEHDTSYSPTMYFYDAENEVDDRLANFRVYGRKNSSLNGNYMNYLTTYDNPVKIGDYAVAKKDEVCYVLTVDKDGKASTENIFPIGKYEIVETKGNDYYQCNTEWSFPFEIDGTEATSEINAECENTLKPAKIIIQKRDVNSNPITSAKFYLEWSKDGQTDWQPVIYSDGIVMGGCSNIEMDENNNPIPMSVDSNGELTFEGLYPVVYYRITEVETGNGYQLLKEPIIVNSQLELIPYNNFEVGYRVVNGKSFDLPQTGAYDFLGLGLCFVMASVAMFVMVSTLISPAEEKKRK